MQPHLAALAPFAITPDILETLTLTVKLFANKIILPKETVKTKKDATAKMALLIKQNSKLLNTQLDALVIGIEDAESEFVAIYRRLRHLRKLIRTKISLTSTVINALTYHPIEGAHVEVPSCKIKRMSSPKGRNTIKKHCHRTIQIKDIAQGI